MSVWTQDQVRKARGIRAKVEIDESFWDVPPRDELLGLLHKHMQRIADTFAIMLDGRDIRMEQTDLIPKRAQVVVTAWWEPESRSIEVRGGHEDGRTYEFRGAPHEPLMIVPPRQPVGPYDTTLWPSDLQHPIRLECIGWHEQDRHWVYGATS